MGGIEQKCIHCNGLGYMKHSLETPQAIDAKTRIKSALNNQLTRKLWSIEWGVIRHGEAREDPDNEAN